MHRLSGDYCFFVDVSLLLELDGIRVLTDPNFEPKLGRLLPRVSPPGIALDRRFQTVDRQILWV